MDLAGILFTLSIIDSNKIASQFNTNNNKSIMFQWIASGETKKVLEFLDNIETENDKLMKSINEKLFLGNTFLNCATEYSNYDVTKRLLELGANPNMITDTWCCPLVNAVVHKDRKMVDLLLEYGAKLNVLFFFFDRLVDYNDPQLMDRFLGCCTLEQLKKLDLYYPNFTQQILDKKFKIRETVFKYYTTKLQVDDINYWNIVEEFI